MMANDRGILSTVGNTPLVRLTRVFDDCNFRLFAKLEGFNPGGSIKDRPALRIVETGIESGLIRSDTVIIESSSGNLGIGLSQVCLYFGLRFICVVDPKTTPQNIRLLQTYGAEVDMVDRPDPETGEYLPARLARVGELLNSFDNAFWPNQYANLCNAAAHHRTMREIVEALDGDLDYLFCSTSTCGTLRGCAEYARDRSLKGLTIVGVDAVGSVIFGGPNAKRLIPGHGASVRPALYRAGLANHSIFVSDWECVVGCRTLLSREALLVGGSSGGTLMAARRMKQEIPDGASVVLILPDRGERYLDTVFSNEWVMDHFGELPNVEEKNSRRRPVELDLISQAAGPSLLRPQARIE